MAPHSFPPADWSESQTLISGGVFGSDFGGGIVDYEQPLISHQPTLIVTGSGSNSATIAFTDFPFGNPSNGVPGNGNFHVSGVITDSAGTLARLGSATVAGVPEPTTWVMLMVGAGAMMAGFKGRRKLAPSPRATLMEKVVDKFRGGGIQARRLLQVG
jgi:hypothetical protein